MQTKLVVFGGISAVALALGCGSDAGSGEGDGDTTLGTVSAPDMTGTGGTATPPAGTGGSTSSGIGTGGASPPVAGSGSMGTGGVGTGGTGTGGVGTGGMGTGGMGTGGTGTGGMGTGGMGTGGSDPNVPMLTGNFSFFVVSVEAIRELSGNQEGFGGNLGGLEGADSICQRTAAMEGAGHKTWRAFLSATQGGAGGGPVHAIDRVGEGPWYDRNGKLLAMNKAGLTSGNRPAGDPSIINELPNERGEPLGQGDTDDHDILTGSTSMGMLQSTDRARTCNDWTSAEVLTPTGGGGGGFGGAGPMCGHAWPAMSGQGWIQAHGAPGCTPGIRLVQTGPPPAGSTCVGCGGGYGGFYCFALEP